MKKNKGKNIFLRVNAFFVLLSFTLFNLLYQPSVFAVFLDQGVAQPAMTQFNPSKFVASMNLPEVYGHVLETFLPEGSGPSDHFVIYVQNAHANQDAERNTRNLITHFEEKNNLRLILLEGGSGALDSLFFKSFPDEKLKEQVLFDYLKKGDLSGGEVASILDTDHDARYYGIENQDLYERNKKAFLDAISNEKKILNELDQYEIGIRDQISYLLSEEAKIFYEKKEALRRDEINLIQYLKSLKELHTTLLKKYVNNASSSQLGADLRASKGQFRPFSVTYAEIVKTIEAESNEKTYRSSDFDIATNDLIQRFKKEVLPNLSRDKKIETNQLLQTYQIGLLGRGMLVSHIQGISRELNYFLEVPEALKPTALHAKTLESIQGTKLFKELEALEVELRDSLPNTDEERSLLFDIYHLEVLRDFAKLELLHKHWGLLKDKKPSELLSRHPESSNEATAGNYEIDLLFDPHFKFYKLALERDEALFQNMLRRISDEKSNLTLVSTGGFHSEGITEKLKKEQIPYVLLAPKINQLGNRSHYLDAMQGRRSFMKYFSGSLWDALAQDYATKLAASIRESELTPSLKRWRDRIIQNSIAEGKITQATQYTKYVDALVQALRKEYEKGSDIQALEAAELRQELERELNSFFDTYFAKLEMILKQKLDLFSKEFRKMWQEKNMTAKSLESLFDRINMTKTSNIAVALALVRGGVPSAQRELDRFEDSASRAQVKQLAASYLEQLGVAGEGRKALIAQLKAAHDVLDSNTLKLAGELAGLKSELRSRVIEEMEHQIESRNSGVAADFSSNLKSSRSAANDPIAFAKDTLRSLSDVEILKVLKTEPIKPTEKRQINLGTVISLGQRTFIIPAGYRDGNLIIVRRTVGGLSEDIFVAEHKIEVVNLNDNGVIVGRDNSSEAELKIPDLKISRNHGKLSRSTDGTLWFHNHNPTNGSAIIALPNASAVEVSNMAPAIEDLSVSDSSGKEPQLAAAGKLDTGNKYPGRNIEAFRQEDAIVVREKNGVRLYAAIDGMGGEYGGREASQMTQKVLENDFDNGRFENVESAQVGEAIREMIHEVYEAFALSSSLSEKKIDGMTAGVTIVIAVQMFGQVHIYHVGDASAYMQRTDGAVAKITKDHSVADEMGLMDGSKPLPGIIKNKLTRFIGAEGGQYPRTVLSDGRTAYVIPELDGTTYHVIDVREFKRLILMSDGIPGEFSNHAFFENENRPGTHPDPHKATQVFASALREVGDQAVPRNVADTLISKAIQFGEEYKERQLKEGKKEGSAHKIDNLSVIVIEKLGSVVQEGFDARGQKKEGLSVNASRQTPTLGNSLSPLRDIASASVDNAEEMARRILDVVEETVESERLKAHVPTKIPLGSVIRLGKGVYFFPYAKEKGKLHYVTKTTVLDKWRTSENGRKITDVTKGKIEITQLEEDGVTIGRNASQGAKLIIGDDRVSRNHGQLSLGLDGVLVYKDNGSKNGTKFISYQSLKDIMFPARDDAAIIKKSAADFNEKLKVHDLNKIRLNRSHEIDDHEFEFQIGETRFRIKHVVENREDIEPGSLHMLQVQKKSGEWQTVTIKNGDDEQQVTLGTGWQDWSVFQIMQFGGSGRFQLRLNPEDQLSTQQKRFAGQVGTSSFNFNWGSLDHTAIVELPNDSSFPEDHSLIVRAVEDKKGDIQFHFRLEVMEEESEMAGFSDDSEGENVPSLSFAEPSILGRVQALLGKLFGVRQEMRSRNAQILMLYATISLYGLLTAIANAVSIQIRGDRSLLANKGSAARSAEIEQIVRTFNSVIQSDEDGFVSGRPPFQATVGSVNKGDESDAVGVGIQTTTRVIGGLMDAAVGGATFLNVVQLDYHEVFRGRDYPFVVVYTNAIYDPSGDEAVILFRDGKTKRVWPNQKAASKAFNTIQNHLVGLRQRRIDSSKTGLLLDKSGDRILYRSKTFAEFEIFERIPTQDSEGKPGSIIASDRTDQEVVIKTDETGHQTMSITTGSGKSVSIPVSTTRLADQERTLDELHNNILRDLIEDNKAIQGLQNQMSDELNKVLDTLEDGKNELRSTTVIETPLSEAQLRKTVTQSSGAKATFANDLIDPEIRIQRDEIRGVEAMSRNLGKEIVNRFSIFIKGAQAPEFDKAFLDELAVFTEGATKSEIDKLISETNSRIRENLEQKKNDELASLNRRMPLIIKAVETNSSEISRMVEAATASLDGEAIRTVVDMITKSFQSSTPNVRQVPASFDPAATVVQARGLLKLFQQAVPAGVHMELRIPEQVLNLKPELRLQVFTDLMEDSLNLLTLFDIKLVIVSPRLQNELLRAKNRLLGKATIAEFNLAERFIISKVHTEGATVYITPSFDEIPAVARDSNVIGIDRLSDGKRFNYVRDSKLLSKQLYLGPVLLTKKDINQLFVFENGIYRPIDMTVFEYVIHIATLDAEQVRQLRIAA
jgi:serine/threonine protein phosphatase PrpC